MHNAPLLKKTDAFIAKKVDLGRIIIAHIKHTAPKAGCAEYVVIYGAKIFSRKPCAVY